MKSLFQYLLDWRWNSIYGPAYPAFKGTDGTQQWKVPFQFNSVLKYKILTNRLNNLYLA